MALTAQEEALVRQLLDEQAAILSLASSEATILSKLGATKVTLSDLTAVSTVADADLLLMRQGTTDKSLSALIFGAYVASAIPDASETVKGKVELATDAEVQTGTDTTRAVTPAGFSSRTATETRLGIVELATDAEAQAFAANKFIDGAKLNTGFKGGNQSLATNGFQKFPGGLIVQWGIIAGNGSVTFPLVFPSAIRSLTLGANLGTGGDAYTSAVTTSGFTIAGTDPGESNYWCAIGY